jgi:GT2 family glycosyltransferase
MARAMSGAGAADAPPSGRVTSMARWLSRRRQQEAGDPVPQISIVIPVYNAERTLSECLTWVFRSAFEPFEVILVDDGSTDRSRTIASTFPCRIVSTSGRVGPAKARNVGAREARGDVLFFIDSDVMLSPDGLETLAAAFEADEVDAVCGVQTAEMRHHNLASQYKNLWMRWTYLRHTGQVPLFYTTAAAIRRDVFERVGGFDEGYETPNVEDTAFGQRLARDGFRVHVLAPLEVEHVKHYSLWGLLKTDFMRAVSLTRLKLRHPTDLGDNNTSVPTAYILSVGVLGLALALGAVGWWLGSAGVLGAGGALGLASIALNAEFLRTIHRVDGVARTFASVPVLAAELLVVGAGTAMGFLGYAVGRRY